MNRSADRNDAISKRGYLLVLLWATGILILYAVGGCFGVRTLRASAVAADTVRQTWLESGTPAAETGAAGGAPSAGAGPVAVRTGIYLHSVGEVSVKESTWSANFDIWFRWTGDAVAPGRNFVITNGQIEQRDIIDAYVLGREHYERYRVKARLQKFFDATRFPFSDQVLLIQIEDGARGVARLRYVADVRESSINRSGILQSLKITDSAITSTVHNYGTRRGDERLSNRNPDVYSQLTFAMLVSLPGAVIYLKMFQAVFAAVAIALIVFFIKPTHVDPRFGLGVGALFAVIGNNMFVGTILPSADAFTLSAMVNATGLTTIFLTLIQSTLSLYLEDSLGKGRLRILFDRVSFAVFLAGYLSVNVLLPLAART